MPRFGAVDIGSNSIRMQAAEAFGGEPPRILAEDREVTRLGESVFRDGVVSPEAVDQSCRVLARMAATLRDHHVLAVRAVATSAIRDARNQAEFLERVQRALGGTPAEIISGQEEARLIHLGVQSRWPHPHDDLLIVDIGGGSAELIESRAGEFQGAFSKPLGAVRLTELFFHSDPPHPAEIRQFTEYVDEKLAPVTRRFETFRPARVILTAATAAAVVRAIHRVPASRKEEVDRFRVETSQVRELFERLATRNVRERRLIEGIGPRRAEIITAGCGALALILESLGVREAFYASAGVRDGIIADLIHREVAVSNARLDADQRRSAVEMARRCGVLIPHAERTARLAGQLFDQLEPIHRLPPSYGGLLEAAGYLHDVGHFVSDSRHHHHSYYLVAYSDLPGFTNKERQFIASLCRYHRKSMPRSGQETYKALDAEGRKALVPLIPLLRLADSLDRSHEQRVQQTDVRINDTRVELLLRGMSDMALEEWAAQQHARNFQDVYDRELHIRVERTPPQQPLEETR